MDSKITNISIFIDGMTCSSCEARIESMLNKQAGILKAKVSLAAGKADITYDEALISEAKIFSAIEKLGYHAAHSKSNEKKNKFNRSEKKDALKIDQLIGIGIIIFALYMIIKHTVGFNFIPEINQSMGYGVLFVVGLLTSLHCVAMCGGINLSQCISYQENGGGTGGKLRPSLMYNAGRVISYTIVGGIVGGIGSVVSFSGMAKGIVAVLAGVFMIVMGLNMLNVFPWLRRFNVSMPKSIGKKLYSGDGRKGPFYVGLLNGLMPCGPLQSMQLYALGTGSIAAGAASMFFFSLGTVPLMFGLGAVSTMLSKKFTGKLMKVSAILVVVLGVLMISRGMSLSGLNTAFASTPKNSNVAAVSQDVQTVEIQLGSSSYAPITVQKGIPVRFIINAEQQNINGCNGTVIIPKYGIEKELKAGQNVIEFTPEETGKVPYSCWMGMIRSTINVVDDITQVKQEDISEADSQGLTGSASCCAGGANVKSLSDTAIEDIYVAKAENNLQTVKIAVDENGYTPNIIVLQKGIKAKFVFDAKNLNSCNSTVVFPEYQGSINLGAGQLETPELEVSDNFGFSCSMGMLTGYVKVVDDINQIDLEAVKAEAQNYSPTGSSGSGSCCN